MRPHQQAPRTTVRAQAEDEVLLCKHGILALNRNAQWPDATPRGDFL